jgi:ABC-type uncharacterized transport system ATPase subunit
MIGKTDTKTASGPTVSKMFGQACRVAVDLEFDAGEVHAIVDENG